jgi:hypothetical protein
MRGLAGFVGVALLCATAASAQSLTVLKVKSVTRAITTISFVLESGTSITVAASDVDTQMMQVLEIAIKEVQAEALTEQRRRTNPPSPAPATVQIQQKCEKDWPTDFRMQVYCQTQQNEALTALARRNMDGDAGETIRRQCFNEWQGDYRMMNYCEEQQLKALETLRQR